MLNGDVYLLCLRQQLGSKKEGSHPDLTASGPNKHHGTFTESIIKLTLVLQCFFITYTSCTDHPHLSVLLVTYHVFALMDIMLTRDPSWFITVKMLYSPGCFIRLMHNWSHGSTVLLFFNVNIFLIWRPMEWKCFSDAKLFLYTLIYHNIMTTGGWSE